MDCLYTLCNSRFGCQMSFFLFSIAVNYEGQQMEVSALSFKPCLYSYSPTCFQSDHHPLTVLTGEMHDDLSQSPAFKWIWFASSDLEDSYFLSSILVHHSVLWRFCFESTSLFVLLLFFSLWAQHGSLGFQCRILFVMFWLAEAALFLIFWLAEAALYLWCSDWLKLLRWFAACNPLWWA